MELTEEQEHYIKYKVKYIKMCQENITKIKNGEIDSTNLKFVEEQYFGESSALLYYCDKKGLDYEECFNKY